jgi:hypothetical protein
MTNSLAAVQAENGLRRQLWIVTLDEAYNAKDAVRRTEEITQLAEHEVVEVYGKYHPEMKRWADGHIQDGTCEAAIHEMRAEPAQAANRAQSSIETKLFAFTSTKRVAIGTSLDGDFVTCPMMSGIQGIGQISRQTKAVADF